LPGLLTAITGLVAAIAGLITALKAAGLIGAVPWISPPSTPTPVQHAAVASPLPNPESDAPTQAPRLGTTGWIYVGTRVNNQWRTTFEEGIEPARTLDFEGLPQRGMTYQLVHGVNIREEMPVSRVPGERPVMTKSVGALRDRYLVKVDDVREVLLTNPTRIWVWAHATVVGQK
jgi:hypothetical protein